MLVLDTDHLSELQRGSNRGTALSRKLRGSGREIATTIVNLEEQLRGWLAELGRIRNVTRLIEPYRRLQVRLSDYTTWRILEFDNSAAAALDALRLQGLRVGTMDLRVASVVIANRATLLTRNTKDFAKIPGLRLEDWL